MWIESENPRRKIMSESPEQEAALDAIETKVNALSAADRALLEAYLQSHHDAPNTAEEAVALIPAIEAAIKHVTGVVAVPARVKNAAQTTGAVNPLQPLSR
jgi:hypothetical protein